MPIAILPLLAQWVLLSNHTHTDASPDSTLKVADLARAAESRGVQAVVITDHNSVAGVLDPAFHATGSVTLIEGQEWGDILGGRFIGHVGMMGLRGDITVDPGLPLEKALAEATARGALSVINHPFNSFLSFKFPEIPAGAGGVEIWNQPWNTWGMDNPKALAWWDAALRHGRRAVGVGGSDVHGLHFLGDAFSADKIDTPVNLVWADDASLEAIMRGLHAGRVVITRDAGGPRLDLHAGSAGIGDEVAATGSVAVQARVAGGRGMVLSLHTSRGKVFETPVDADDADFAATVETAPDHDFVRAELRETTGWPEPAMAALTNPVYFKR